MVKTRIIPAVGKHVIAERALAGGNQHVGVEETAGFGVIETGV